MKNFYAILAAALVGSAAASAQLPAKSLKEAKPTTVTGLQMSETPAPVATMNAVNSSIVGQTLRKAAPSRSEDNLVDFQFGEYVVTYYSDETPFTTRFLPTVISKDEKNVTDSTVVVSQFYYSDFLDMNAVTIVEDIEFSSGVQTLPVLKIASGTPCFTNEETGTTYGLYLCSPSQQKIYSNDLEWIIDESGELWFLYNNTVCLGFFAESPQGGYNGSFLDPGTTFYKKNAEMTAMFYDGDNGYEEATCPVWTYVVDGQYTDTGEPYKAVFAAGWGGCGEAFHFMIEDLGEEHGYIAAAYEQAGWALSDAKTDQFYYCDVVMENGEPDYYWVVDGKEQMWMVATVGVDGEGNTVFAQDGDWVLIGDQGLVTFWKEGLTVFDYNIGVGGGGESGIEAVESNENAPAEYYNLQGVKVANPVAGQLYIVKQGSKVSKVIR